MRAAKGKVIIVHGWNNKPDHGWLGWLAKELATRGYEVIAPPMPLPHTPRLADWSAALGRAAGTLDGRTVIIGYSLGTAASLKFLHDYGRETKIAGLVLVAGFGEALLERQLPLFDPPLDFDRISRRAATRVSIYSDNDRVVPQWLTQRLARRLRAREIVQLGSGHFLAVPRLPGYMPELPVALEAVLACYPHHRRHLLMTRLRSAVTRWTRFTWTR